MEWWRRSIRNVAQRPERGPETKASQPLGVEYQWIDMLIYGVLMMTYILMAINVDNEGVWRAPSTKQPSKSGRIQGCGNPVHVAFASGMVDGASKVGYAMPSVVVVMHIDICEGRGARWGGVGDR